MLLQVVLKTPSCSGSPLSPLSVCPRATNPHKVKHAQSKTRTHYSLYSACELIVESLFVL